MRFKLLIICALCALVFGSCHKDPKPNEETFKILKEKEKITIGTDRVSFKGEFAYSGIVDSMWLWVGVEEHLYGSEDYPMSVMGKTYSAEIIGLQPGTFYYYAYVVDYGAQTPWQSELYGFTTAEEEINLPTVTTVEVTGVTVSMASCLCNVADDGGSEVTERGACWDTHPNPSISNSSFANGNGCGNYEVILTGLEPGTTYYVRAYAKNRKGVNYGEELSFNTLDELIPPLGAINGLFTVAEGHQVWFSVGNLRYHAVNHEWGFAEEQYQYDGESNANIAEDYAGWIDLFGWGTSGFDHGAVCYQPWSSDSDSDNYFAYGNQEYNLNDQSGQADWGYGVFLEEGDVLVHPWRTLTYEEWHYLFHDRNTVSGIRFVKANVEGVNGVLLLPDDWSTSVYSLNNINQDGASFASNFITRNAFTSYIEPNGGVFLPAAGKRSGMEAEGLGVCGYYWSATAASVKRSLSVMFDADLIDVGTTLNRSKGYSVRLVRDVEQR